MKFREAAYGNFLISFRLLLQQLGDDQYAETTRKHATQQCTTPSTQQLAYYGKRRNTPWERDGRA